MIHKIAPKRKDRPKRPSLKGRVLELVKSNPGSSATELASYYYIEYEAATTLTACLKQMTAEGLLTSKLSKERAMNKRAACLTGANHDIWMDTRVEKGTPRIPAVCGKSEGCVVKDQYDTGK